jgi:Uma2 family endonuclease
MTVVPDRPSAAQPHLSSERFEAIAALALLDEVRLEFLGGRMCEKPVPDGEHDTIIAWLMRVCMQSRPELWFYAERGLKIEEYRRGRARPDGVLAPEGAFLGHDEWSLPDDAVMVVEVTSFDADADQRDRVEKPRAYAQAGIPVHLLIDRDTGETVVHSAPDGQRYEVVQRRPFGKPVELPEPVGFSLDTEPLSAWAR